MLRAEFTVEPFRMGERGPHGEAALAVAQASGLATEDGPFGTSVEGDDESVLGTLHEILTKAMAAGATRISVQLTRSSER